MDGLGHVIVGADGAISLQAMWNYCGESFRCERKQQTKNMSCFLQMNLKFLILFLKAVDKEIQPS